MSTKNKIKGIERQLGIGDSPAKKKTSSKPVSPKTFVESRKYLDAKGELYPEVLNEFIKLNSGLYDEAVLTGGIGSGKTTIAVFTIAYQLYRLSLLKGPQHHFGLARGSEIVFIFQSVNAELAKSVDYARFKALLDHAPYFRKHFRYQRSIESELRFPNRIVVRPISGRSTAALGQNVYGGVIDEMNYMETVDRSKRSPDTEDYDQAKSLYNTIARRRASRFMKNGNLPGVLCLVSSRRYPGQFTDLKEGQRKKQLAKTGESPIYVYDKRAWEVKPKGRYSGEMFHVFVGDESRNPRILHPGDSVAQADQGLLMEVPVEHRDEFEADLVDALRELAGVSLLASRPFFTNREAVAACFGTHESILSHESAVLPDDELRLWYSRFYQPQLLRWVHLDMSLSCDATGIVIGCIKGFKKIPRGDTIETLPIIHIDCALQLRPPKGGEIQYEHIRELIYLAMDHGLAIQSVTADAYQSVDTLQILAREREHIKTGNVSMDRDIRPYQILKTTINDGRLDIPNNDVLLRELNRLELDTKKGKVDHPPGGSKDLADALAGVVFRLSSLPKAWREHGVSRYKAAPGLVSVH